MKEGESFNTPLPDWWMNRAGRFEFELNGHR
jgi:hypothetical protein